MLYNELPIIFPWYEKREQQDRYRENVDQSCSYKLITPKNSLLPFQFYKPAQALLPLTWQIFTADSGAMVSDISAQGANLHLNYINGFDYLTWDGRPISTLSLSPGWYFSVMTFAAGYTYYSELFFIPDAGSFKVEDDENIPFIKLQFWNNNDIAPIFYNEQDPLGGSYFKQTFYVDSFITASEPEITEDGTKDGNDQIIPTFQTATISYRITDGVADYVKKALVLLPMHDSVNLTTKYGVRSGQLQKVAVDSSLEGNGAVSIVDIIFQETVAMVKKGCADNMAKNCPGDPTTMDPLTYDISGNYNIKGYAAPGTVVYFYGSATSDGPKTKLSLNYTAAQFVAGQTTPTTSFATWAFVSAKALTTGCDFGFSTPQQKP